MGASKSDLEFAKRELKKARTILERAEDSQSSEDSATADNPEVGVKDGRESIEVSVKAILKSAGVTPPEEHSVPLSCDRIKGIVYNNYNMPNQLYKDVLRAVFLTSSWDPYYEPARYGIRERNLPASVFISDIDIDRAITDAKFCLETAETFHYYQMKQNGHTISDLDLA